MSDINLDTLRKEFAEYLCEVEPDIKEKAPGITQTETLMVVVCSLFQAAKELKQEKAEQASRVAELSLDLERARNERNAAHVKARREIHAEYRDRIAELEARAGEAVAVPKQGWTGHSEADNAIILLGRLDVEPDDDLRVDQIELAVRLLAAQVKALSNPPTGDAAGKDSVDAAAFMKFAALVLKEHRSDCGPIDLDGHFLQDTATACGLLEERVVTAPCGGACLCSGATDFPTVCYFITDAGRAAIASLTKTADGEKDVL